VQPHDPRFREHPTVQLAVAARPLRRLQHAHLAPLPGRGIADRAHVRRHGLVAALAAPGAGGIGFTGALIALTFIDIDEQLLPDSITLPLLWAGLLFNLAAGEHAFVGIEQAVIGAVAGYLSLWLVYQAFKLATGQGRHGLRRLQAAGGDRRLARAGRCCRW
jgi:hypothetical protein